MEFADESNVTIQYDWCTDYELDNELDVISNFMADELISDGKLDKTDREYLLDTADGEYYIEANMEDDNGYDHQVLIRKRLEYEEDNVQ